MKRFTNVFKHKYVKSQSSFESLTYTKQQIIISDIAIVNIYVGLYTP